MLKEGEEPVKVSEGGWGGAGGVCPTEQAGIVWGRGWVLAGVGADGGSQGLRGMPACAQQLHAGPQRWGGCVPPVTTT